MGKPLEMYVLIFLQSMVQIRARNVGFTTKILFRFFCILSLGALVAESPQEGAIQQKWEMILSGRVGLRQSFHSFCRSDGFK